MEVTKTSITVTQDVDCCGPSNDWVNSLEVSTEDGGGGPYLILKTDRWAIDRDDIDKFCDFLKKIFTYHDR